MSHEDIRERLAAVEGLDWGKVERESDAESCTDWVHVGPVQMTTTFSPGPADAADVARTEAVVEFLQHAADDLRRLLDAQGNLAPWEREFLEKEALTERLVDLERRVAALEGDQEGAAA